MAVLTGGCLCGRVRYEVESDGAVVDYCHCDSCRRSTGGATVAWMQVKPDRFRVTAGEAATYRSSPGATRHFCRACGSQLFMTDGEGRSVGITLGTLDDKNAVAPTAHGWDGDRPSWLCLTDDLPRFAGSPDYDS